MSERRSLTLKGITVQATCPSSLLTMRLNEAPPLTSSMILRFAIAIAKVDDDQSEILESR